MKYKNKKLTIRRIIRGQRYRVNELDQYLWIKQNFRHNTFYRVIMLTLSSFFITTKKYQKLIEPEVNNEFAAIIQRVFKESKISTVIEVGASSGRGSTQVIIDCMQEYSEKANLRVHLIEISPIRAGILTETYRNLVYVTVHNKSTVTPAEHMSPLDLLNFNRDFVTKMRSKLIVRPLRWLRQDIKFLKENPFLWNPTAFGCISDELDPNEVDFALIDGGFCGLQDTKKVFGAKYIALDDINDAKNFLSFRLLKDSSAYELVESNYKYRNGYAVFRKR